MEYVLIAAGVIVVGLIIILIKWGRTDEAESADEQEETDNGKAHVPPASCCGAHEVCEAETLLTLTDKIIYYDDEELDRFRGVGPDDYDDAQTDEFREVLLTLQPHEVAGWLRSLNLRRVEPPAEVRDEALMVVSEFRDERRNAADKHRAN